MASVIGNLVQSKLGVIEGAIAMWLLNQSMFVRAGASGARGAPICDTYVDGLAIGSKGVGGPKAPPLLSDAAGVTAFAAEASMLGTGPLGIGSGPLDAEIPRGRAAEPK